MSQSCATFVRSNRSSFALALQFNKLISSNSLWFRMAATSTEVKLIKSSRYEVVLEVTKAAGAHLDGIELGSGKGGSIIVTSISPEGPFARSKLQAGMQIDSINGEKYATYNEGMALIYNASGQVTIVATNVKEIDSRDDNLCLIVGNCLCAGVDCGCCIPCCVIQ